MKKTILSILITICTVNAQYLKYDEFDITKLGKAFETYVIQTNKKFNTYDIKFQEHQQKIKLLQNKLHSLEKQLEKKDTNNSIQTTSHVTISPINEQTNDHMKDIRLIIVKRGIMVFSAPFHEEDLYLKRYDYNTPLEIESCDQYGWCKLKDKEEYVAEYLLSNNETD